MTQPPAQPPVQPQPGEQQQSYMPPPQQAPYGMATDQRRASLEGRAKRDIAFGAVWLAFGLLITIITYANASGPSGGVYIVAWGPSLYGVIRIGSGIYKMQKARN